ncbi:MAG: hypothetical protein LAP38_14085 [Acidobacteriia bacterium]|nr:hypothetical protein [Terriglobia bacterium]
MFTTAPPPGFESAGLVDVRDHDGCAFAREAGGDRAIRTIRAGAGHDHRFAADVHKHPRA